MFNNLLELEWGEDKEKIKRYVQRDLEDQIEEEYAKQGKEYQRTQKQEKMPISTKEVAKLLKEGYTRYKKDDKGYGSIQEKYDLSGLEVVELFTTPSIKYMKTVLPKQGLEIVDDLNDDEAVLDNLTDLMERAANITGGQVISNPTITLPEPAPIENPVPEATVASETHIQVGAEVDKNLFS